MKTEHTRNSHLYMLDISKSPEHLVSTVSILIYFCKRARKKVYCQSKDEKVWRLTPILDD